jgi:hypothetical protein
MSYRAAGGLPNIPRWTLMCFKELLLQCLARVNSVGWEVVACDIKYYSDTLHFIRTTSTTRIMHLVKTYVFLRDARHASFMTHKQLTDRVTNMSKKLLLNTPAPNKQQNNGGRAGCSRCNGTFHPERPTCPFVGMTYAKSRAAAKQVQAKIDGGMTVQLAIKEVLDAAE